MNEPLSLCPVCGHTVHVAAPCMVCDVHERRQAALEANMKAYIAAYYRGHAPHLRGMDTDV